MEGFGKLKIFPTMLLKYFLQFILIIVIWIILVSFYTFYTSIHPKKIISGETPADFNLQYEEVTFPTPDGLNLRGWFIPSAAQTDKTIIILHGYPADKGDVLRWGIFLQPVYNLLFFDFRGLGQSEGSYTTVGYLEPQDLLGALDYLKSRKELNPDKIGIMGFSLGGAVAIMTASQAPGIKAIVADSAFAKLDNMLEIVYKNFFFIKKPFIWMTKLWARLFLKVDVNKIAPQEAAKEVTIPLLIINGEKDILITPENAQAIYNNAAGPKELWLVKGAEHGVSYFAAKDEYEKKALDFFQKYLN